MQQEEGFQLLPWQGCCTDPPHVVRNDSPSHGIVPQKVAREDNARNPVQPGVEERDLANILRDHGDEGAQDIRIVSLPAIPARLGKKGCGQSARKLLAACQLVVTAVDVLHQQVDLDVR